MPISRLAFTLHYTTFVDNLSNPNSSPIGVDAGTSVQYVLQQDREAFIRLVGVSILQSGVSAFLAPSLR